MRATSLVWRQSRWDAAPVALAVVYALALVRWPLAPVVALGVWWGSNSIAHLFLHQPFFRAGWLNRVFALALSGLLGIPQRLWRDMHMAHHQGIAYRLTPSLEPARAPGPMGRRPGERRRDPTSPAPEACARSLASPSPGRAHPPG